MGVAPHAPGCFKHFPAPPGRFGQSPPFHAGSMALGAPLPPCLLFGRGMRHQERAGNFLHVFQVCIHAFRQFTGRFQKLDVHKACRHGHFRRGADAQRHHRACPVGKEHGARIFRVAHAVIQQIPVQAVHPAVRVAGGAALPPLEAMGGIIKIPFPQFFPGRPELAVQGNCPGFAGILQGDFRQRIRKVAGHINVFPIGGHGARAVQGQSDPGAETVQETKPFGNRLIAPAFPLHALQQGREINYGEFMRPRMRHEQFSAISGKRNAPRVGRPRIRVIQQNGMRLVRLVRIDNRHGIRVHPAAVQLRGGHLVPAQYMRHGQIAAIRAYRHAAHALRPVGKREMDSFSIFHQSQRGSREIPVRSPGRQMAGSPDFPAVRRNGQHYGFTGDIPGIQHGSGSGVHFQHAGIKPAGHIQLPFPQHRRHGRMPGRKRTLQFPAFQVHYFHHSARSPLRHINRRAIHGHAVGRLGQPDAFHLFPGSRVHQFQHAALMPQHSNQVINDLHIHRSQRAGSGILPLPA